MSVYLAAFDETQNSAGHFTLGGFVGPEGDWRNYFEPAWEERVLAGPPRIPYFHMTEIRDDRWQARQGISAVDASRRIDEAVRVLVSMGSLHPITVSLNGSDFRELWVEPLRKMRGFGEIADEPDYRAFIAYVVITLRFVNTMLPDATRVDVLAEKSQKTTATLKLFHEQLSNSLGEFPEMARLLGAFVSAGKTSIPLQAADLFCWHVQRSDAGRLHPIDRARFRKLTQRIGYRHIENREGIREMSEHLQAERRRKT